MMSKKSVYLGIDFGTCNIVVSEYLGPNRYNTNSFTSRVIYDTSLDRLIYKKSVENNRYDFPLLRNEKRLIGRNYSQLDEVEKKTLGLINDEDKILYYFSNKKQKHFISPIEFSSKVILNALEEYKEKDISCVMCVPAVYSFTRRNGIKQAFEKTKKEILDIITDTSATALYLAYNDKIKNGITMICDFGGGILDISIIERNDKTLTIIGNGGDDHLGGEDILNEIVNYIAEQVKDKINIYEDTCKYRRIIDGCEHFIKFYQSEKIKTIEIEDGINVDITQDIVNTIMHKYCDRITEKINQNLNNFSLKLANISCVVGVGGITKNSMINAVLKSIFKDKNIITDLDYSVAKGASIYAHIVSEEKNEKFVIKDRTYSYLPLFGIDLGNICSCISYLEDPGKPYEIRTIKNSILHSTVAYNKTTNEILYNRKIDAVDLNLFSIIYDSKKYIGKIYEEIEKEDLKYYFYKIKYQYNLPIYEVTANNDKLMIKASTITSMLFGSIKKEFNIYHKSKDKTPAIVTVPLEFGTIQRSEILKSAEENNIKVVQMINDETAAALYQCYAKSIDNCYIAVYNLSGNRFNSSFIDVSEGVLTVKDFENHSELGGKNITKDIIECMLKKVKNVSESLLPRLYLEAEKCKTILLKEEKYEVFIDDMTSVTISKSDFEDILENNINKTIEVYNNIVKRNKDENKNVVALIMVEVPEYVDKIRLKINELEFVICSKESISNGAVLYAKSMSEKVIEHYEIRDIVTKSLGIEINQIFSIHKMEFIIKKMEILPVEKEIEVDLDNGKRTFEIYEGESKNTTKNKYIGSVDIDIPLEKCKDNKINIIFSVDRNGILKLKYKTDEMYSFLTINYHN